METAETWSDLTGTISLATWERLLRHLMSWGGKTLSTGVRDGTSGSLTWTLVRRVLDYVGEDSPLGQICNLL